MLESDTARLFFIYFFFYGTVGGEGRRNSLLSSDLSRLEPGDKVSDCLVLEVGVQVAGEGPICVALFCSTKKEKKRCSARIAVILYVII